MRLAQRHQGAFPLVPFATSETPFAALATDQKPACEDRSKMYWGGLLSG